MIVVIDEFPYLVAKEPTIEAVLQLLWDRTFQRQAVLVVLIGSDRATMEALTEEGRPLYDRAREIVVSHLRRRSIGAMLDLPPARALDAYTVIGGFPVLALEWGRGRSREEYLADALTDPSSFLVVSAEKVLAAELPVESQARAVLSADRRRTRAPTRRSSRAPGCRRPRSTGRIDVFLAKGIVERLTPYSTKPSPKNRQYVVSDPYLRFWLRFLAGQIDTIDRGRGELILADIEQNWSAFRGRAIEPIVREAIERRPTGRAASAGRATSVASGTATTRSRSTSSVPTSTPSPSASTSSGRSSGARNKSFDRHDTAALAGHAARPCPARAHPPSCSASPAMASGQTAGSTSNSGLRRSSGDAGDGGPAWL